MNLLQIFLGIYNAIISFQYMCNSFDIPRNLV